MKHTHILLLVLAAFPAIVLLFMSGVFTAPFDTETITRFITPFTFQGHDNVGWAVMESTQWHIFRPIYSLSILFDYKMWGTDPLMYHVTDLFLSWTGYALALFLLKKRFGLFIASAAVLIWSVAPAQAMSLSRIYGRNDRLVNLFIILALLFYDRYCDSAGGRRAALLLASVLCVVMATLSKETGIFYAILLPLWGVVVLRRNVPELVRSQRFLWIILAVLGAAFFLLRHLAGFRLSIDSEGFVSFADYLTGMSRLILMGIPFPIRFSPDPVIVCALTAAAVVLTAVIRKIPSSARYGAIAFSAVILPLPILWITVTFLWGYSLWASLWAGGLLSMAVEPLWGRSKAAGKWALALSASLLLVCWGLWSGEVVETVVSPIKQVNEAAIYAASVSPGPVYRVIEIGGPYSDWWRSLENMPPQEKDKTLHYASEILRLTTGDPQAIVVLAGNQ